MKNKGYAYEKALSQRLEGFERTYSNLHHKIGGDLVDNFGTHYQVKFQNGQMSLKNPDFSKEDSEILIDRILAEFSNNFIIGIPKGKEIINYFFTKENFIKILLQNRRFWKIEKMVDNEFHIRFSFSHTKGMSFELRKFSYKIEKFGKENLN